MKLLVFVFGCIVLQCVLGVSTASQSSCNLVATKPERLMKSIGHSSDNQALVFASAYLRYHADDQAGRNSSSYMALSFRNYEFDERNSLGQPELTLEADCAKLVMAFDEIGRDYSVKTIDVHLEVPNKGVHVCTISQPLITQEHGTHYGCDLSWTPRACKAKVGDKEVKVVDVVFRRLEFELFGSPVKTMHDEFSTIDTNC